MRLNSGAGIGVGTGSRVRNCDVHHNGQIGIAGNGNDILHRGQPHLVEQYLWLRSGWEAGGVKIAESDGVTFRGNHVHDNYGLGLWCDVDCRNVVYEEISSRTINMIGIFHEISFKAVIRNNVLRHNGRGDRGWFWGADIRLLRRRTLR